MMWSRIQDTELALEALIRINANEINGCDYHNYDHVESMYHYLEDTKVPYDEALDWAVLFHDIVYDDKPDKELRSAQLFIKMATKHRGCMLSQFDQFDVYNLILKTVDHKIDAGTRPSDSAIVRADLHALTDSGQVVRNFVKIMDESMSLYGCSAEDFAEKNILFMVGLLERMLLNVLMVDKEEGRFYNDVADGIELTIRLANALRGG